MIKACTDFDYRMLPPAGTGSQGDLMHKDECVLVDEQDAVLGAASKFDAHRFVPGQPAGQAPPRVQRVPVQRQK